MFSRPVCGGASYDALMREAAEAPWLGRFALGAVLMGSTPHLDPTRAGIVWADGSHTRACDTRYSRGRAFSLRDHLSIFRN